MAYIPGQNSALYVGDGASPQSYTNIVYISGLTPPNETFTKSTFKTLESDTPKSVGGGKEEKVVSFRLVWDNALTTHQNLRADALSSTSVTRNYRVLLPYSPQYSMKFNGYVSKWEWEEISAETEIAATIEITVDGDIQVG